MSLRLPNPVVRPLIDLWLHTSPASWRRRVIADDTPHVHAPGSNPDRVLLLGDGIATGRGVATHDLGLPGHLARSLSAETAHATDVDIVVEQNMTVRACAIAIAGLDLFRYDVIVLSIGHNEALGLMSATAWASRLRGLLGDIERRAPAATKTFLLSIPMFGPGTRFPAVFAEIVDDHATTLNAVTSALVERASNAVLVPVSETDEFEPETRHLYRRWADNLAPRISEELEEHRIPARSRALPDETGRDAALERLGDLDAGEDHILTSLAEAARCRWRAGPWISPFAPVEERRSPCRRCPVEGGREGCRCVGGGSAR